MFRREIGREREGVEWARGLTEEVKLTFFMLKTLLKIIFKITYLLQQKMILHTLVVIR